VAFGGGGAFGVDGADGTYSQNEANGAQAAEPHIGLAEFLMHVTLVSDIDNFEDETDKVSLMTIHSAKGLEFDTVFIVGAEDGVFPGNRAMTDSSQLEEERRLCYVSITRAMKSLFITNARSRTLFGNTSYNKPSRFISDIPRDLVKHDLDCRPDADDAQAGSFGGGGSRVGDAQADGFGGGGSRVGGAKRHVATRTAPFGQSPAKSPTGAWRGVGTGAPMRPAQPPARDIGSGVGAGGAGAASYANGRTYAIGDPVRHKKYGNGTVKRREKDGQDVIIEIEFANAGLKRFIESMVSLRKLSE
jgi:DNA helicase-2/ATP-dependent DNA helicase PcrA